MFELKRKVVSILVNEYKITVDQAWSAMLEYENYEIFNYTRIAGISDNLIPNAVTWCLEWLSYCFSPVDPLEDTEIEDTES